MIVLLVVMNWVFPPRLLDRLDRAPQRAADASYWPSPAPARGRMLLGFVFLGLTAIYREGFEIVLFLQELAAPGR